MIHGSSALAIPALSDDDTRAWITSLATRFSSAEVETIAQACELAALAYAEQMEKSGVPLMQHATGTAAILVSINMDAEAVAASILYATPRHIDNWQETLKSRFGAPITNLVAGLLQIEQMQSVSDLPTLHQQTEDKKEQTKQIESLRKMLLAMVQDIRVVLIKLAERTQALRNIAKAETVLQQEIAKEIQGVYAPLANRLGIWQLKWEMEDLSLRYLEPQLYKDIAKSLDSRRVDREQYIDQVVHLLDQQLLQASIKADVSGRPKHIYSIINKMRRKQLSFDQLFDVRAVRILVDTVEDCYTALSIVQALWQPIAGEFDDYIARPKGNNYRSLHTAVNGPEGLPLEVQIRTFEMHEYSELGVAAHWRYKEGGKSDTALDEKIASMRQILTWKDDDKTEIQESGDLLEQFNTELFQENIYVFTPQGKVIDLPKDATPVDFAYALHTGLGHRTRGAKVDGHIVPLTYKLQNAERVEVLTNKQGAPSRDWLRPALGYLKTTSARAKVRHWFRHEHAEEHIAEGRTKLDKELQRAGVASINQEKIAQQLHFNKLEDLLIAIGRGDVSEHQTANAIQSLVNPKPVKKFIPPSNQNTNLHAATEISLEGLGNLQTNIAKCCKPSAPDAIVGYVTRDRGVTVHRQNCAFIKRLTQARKDRILNAEWCPPKT